MQRSTDVRQPGLPDTAEDWMARLLAADCSAEERAAFEAWRAADPERMLAFAEVEYLHDSAAQLADDPLLRAATRAALREKAPSSRQRMAWVISAAAGLMAAVGLVIHLQGVYDTHAATGTRYASTTNVQTINLDDGTRLQLDAASTVTVRFDRNRRIVDLDNGRAEFTVAADPDRPFEVRAGNTVIHDIGTVFQVDRDARHVSVSLLDGRVEISGKHAGHAWQRQLEPAQKLRIDAGGEVGPITPFDVAAARAWPLGQLVFHQRRLEDLLAEANRYSAVQLRLGDASLASLRVSGSISTGDTQTLVKALEQGWQLKATKSSPDQIVLRSSLKKPN